jgi:hypothetical protein
MRKPLIATLAPVLPAILACTAFAQEPNVVEGLVRQQTTNEALPGVAVTIRYGGGNQVHTAKTDEEGRYRIEVPGAGSHEMSFRLSGYIPAWRWVEVKPGATRADVTMQRGNRLSGRVTLHEGRPAAGVAVEVRLRGGRPRYTAIIGPDGVYQFDTLPPGRYFLSAGLRGALVRKESTFRPLDQEQQDGVAMGYARTFYPGVRSAGEAQAIELGSGMDLGGYDIALSRVPVHRLSGRVVDETGAAAGGTALELASDDEWFGVDAETKSAEDGSFEFAAVPEGEWRVRALAHRAGITFRGHALVTLSRRDLDDLRLEITPPFPVEGFVDRDEPRDAKGLRKVTMVTLRPVDGGPSPGLKPHEQDGRVVIPQVYRGRYRIRPLGFAPGFYLESIRVGDQDALLEPVDFHPGMPPFRIAYSPNPGRVTGVVEGGGYVSLLPVEEALWDGQFIRSARVHAGQRFEVANLRPGAYIALAFTEPVDSDELSDPVLAKRVASKGARITVQGGQTTEVKLRAIDGGIW